MKQPNVDLVLTFESAGRCSFGTWMLALHPNGLSNFSCFELRGFSYQSSYGIVLFIDSLTSLLIKYIAVAIASA